ncbi:MAG TPA: hypothetical protein PKN95_03110 [Verrucomicrobiota bacterium]|nr:hypothetical protein [Verrucomicrobiota bacterium]
MFKSYELFGFMSPTLASEILAFAYESEKPTYRAVLQAVAEARRVRPVFLERRERHERHATMLSTLARPNLDVAAGTLLRTWLVKKYQSMLTDFLNALEIPNENGVVEDLPESMSDEKLKAAVEALLAKYPPEAVAVYLNAFNGMNEANWANLQQLLANDPRLQLGAG